MRWVCDEIQEPAWRLPLTSLLPPEAELGNIQDTERRREAHEGGCADGDKRTDSCFPANVSLNANPSADRSLPLPGSTSWERIDWSSLGQRTSCASSPPQTSSTWNGSTHQWRTKDQVVLQEFIGSGTLKQEGSHLLLESTVKPPVSGIPVPKAALSSQDTPDLTEKDFLT